ncbi:Predicted protein [uncultured Eubacteriales bacterium]|uniref:Glucokinase n=1 Tax=uncultured Eubacteriales bacterium TaxID=172733 RepID=A0A212JV67_9FIRM|nr:Predicted protein [uncultured Eubacteriales bacterium]
MCEEKQESASAEGRRYLSVEIGGTKQQIAVGTASGQILERRCAKLGDQTTAAGILAWIKATVDDICSGADFSGIGVGFGGPIDPVSGRIICSLQVEGWKNFSLRGWFEDTFHLPTVVLNDTVTGGVAEWKLGAGMGCRRLFYTNIGTGIGGGLYDRGGYGASSLGYTWLPDWRSTEPGTGTRLEFLCAGPWIESRLRQPGYVPADSVLAGRSAPLTCSDLAEGGRTGDPFCMAELDRVASSFAMGLTNVLALAAPDRLVVGGGVAKMGEVFFSRLRRFTSEFAFVGTISNYQLLPSALMDDAVLAGALLLSGDPALARDGTAWHQSI